MRVKRLKHVIFFTGDELAEGWAKIFPGGPGSPGSPAGAGAV